MFLHLSTQKMQDRPCGETLFHPRCWRTLSQASARCASHVASGGALRCCSASRILCDEHLVALHGGKALATGRTIHELPLKSRWRADAVRELQITLWKTKRNEAAGAETQVHHEQDAERVRAL